jgi:hypothetical protein
MKLIKLFSQEISNFAHSSVIQHLKKYFWYIKPMFKSIQDVFDNYDMNYCKQVITLMNSSVKILLRVPCVLKPISERRNRVFVIYQNTMYLMTCMRIHEIKSFWSSKLECYEKLFPFRKVHQVTTWTLINSSQTRHHKHTGPVNR